MTQPLPETPADKVAAVQAAADAALANGIYAVMTEFGEVQISAVVAGTDGNAWWVSVWQGGPPVGDPPFQVVNPPMLYPDPNGEYLVNGVAHRFDPMYALAVVVGQNGGARGTGKGKGRRVAGA